MQDWTDIIAVAAGYEYTVGLGQMAPLLLPDLTTDNAMFKTGLTLWQFMRAIPLPKLWE